MSNILEIDFIELNDFIFVNTAIESRDILFDESHFSSTPRPRDIVSQVPEMESNDSRVQGQQEVDSDDVLEHRRIKGQERQKIIGRVFCLSRLSV